MLRKPHCADSYSGVRCFFNTSFCFSFQADLEKNPKMKRINVSVLVVLTASSLHWLAALGARDAQWHHRAGICPCLLWLCLLRQRACWAKLKRTRTGATEISVCMCIYMCISFFRQWPSHLLDFAPRPALSSVTRPWGSGCSGGRRPAGRRLRSGSCVSAAGWGCRRTSSCTGGGAVSRRRGHRPPCCTLSTWRRCPSGGW